MEGKINKKIKICEKEENIWEGKAHTIKEVHIYLIAFPDCYKNKRKSFDSCCYYQIVRQQRGQHYRLFLISFFICIYITSGI